MKRKNGTRLIITMVIIMLIFIISTLPAYAESNGINEVNVLDNFIVQIKNPTDTAYAVSVKIIYLDKNGDTIYEKEVNDEVAAFENIKIDAKDFYNSEKTQKVLAEITCEKNVKSAKLDKFFGTFLSIIFIVFITLVSLFLAFTEIDIIGISLMISILLGFLGILVYLLIDMFI
mgnify:CR=1 FL=1